MSGYMDNEENNWSRSLSPTRPVISSNFSDEMAPPLPVRPLQTVWPLQASLPPPPRHQTRSESAVDTGKSFGIKRKAINRSGNSPISLLASPPKHDSANYPFPNTIPPIPKLPAHNDPSPPYNSSPALSPTELPASPLSPGRLDLSLGQEALGGGFRGQQAKLGKLLVFADGTKMLDLVVAANIAMFWRGWKAGRARSGSASFG